MELFKKVFKSLFKIVLIPSIAILSFIVDMLILLEDMLEKLEAKLYPSPSMNNKEYMKKMVKEYNERIKKKGTNLD